MFKNLCNLNWKKHAHELSRGRHFVTNDILNQLYYSLVYPFLTYGLIAWGITLLQLLNLGCNFAEKGSTNNNFF